MTFDIAIVGGGIVGLATAFRLAERNPSLRLLLLEKEDSWAAHQTGHNSGVVHSGIYYKPGSLKARLSIEGGAALEEFCRARGIFFDRCGKLIIATEPSELPRLDKLFERGLEHGLDITRLTGEQIRDIEPNAAGIGAIHVRATAITDYRGIAKALAAELQQRGGALHLGAKVLDLAHRSDSVELIASGGRRFTAKLLVNCAGLHSDRIARLAGQSPSQKIVPFRGEYYTLRADRTHLVKHLIYPVPDPSFPFLGVHFTRMADGSIHAGPNAVLGLRREAYSKFAFHPRDLFETLTYPGFWRLAARHWRMAIDEYRRSFSKRLFAKSLQRLVPAVRVEDLVPSPCGVRAQALDSQGALVDDFLIATGERSFHVLNAPSPAATASLAIGEHLAREISTISLSS